MIKLQLESKTSMTIFESFGFWNIRIETSPVNLNYYRNTKLILKHEINFGYLETSPDMLKLIPIFKTSSDSPKQPNVFFKKNY